MELLEKISEADREIQPYDFDKIEGVKTLGLQWNMSEDSFRYSFDSTNIEANQELTKRKYLSATASIFDPIGFLAPVIIKLKIMYQEMWKLGVDWDEPISPHMQRQWNLVRQQLQCLNNIKIPRWIHTKTNESAVELHGFCDASMSAYAAAVYIKIVKNDKAQIFLLAAKTKVAPKGAKKAEVASSLQETTLPRLELCGALLLAKLFAMVEKALLFPSVTKYAWCDSIVTISWIIGAPTKWKSFVGNRTEKIIQILPPECWRYVATDDNPADCASRGILPSELINHPLWWKGPAWLSLEKSQWPEQPTQIETSLEQRTRLVFKTNVTPIEEPFHEFSSWFKVQRIFATCMRFISNCRTKAPKNEPISINDMQAARIIIIKKVQNTYFAREMEQLQRIRMVTGDSNMASLDPFIDENGLIRVGGRLRNSNLSYNQRHPIILPGRAHITKIIIQHAHEMTMHSGTNATIAFIRNSFWILKARNTVKAVLQKCMRCAKVNSRSLKQIMADLPTPRVAISRPFAHAGIDYAGPFSVRTSKGRGHKTHKSYVVLFICLATKAIHLELVSDLTSTAFIAAFKRFISRRGAPNHMYSDNGTNFCAANKFIQAQTKEEQKQINEQLSTFVTSHMIQWHFNPPAAPHFGGLWEAGVKSVKTHLKKMDGTTFTFEEFATVLAQIEACLNSRPLCPMSDDPSDLRILTPAHFLIGNSLTTMSDCSIDKENPNLLTRWKLVEQKKKEFWEHWSQEYLTRLQQRPKWLKARENLEVGDLVLVSDETTASQKWPMGRIIQVFPGNDGIVRVAKIKTMFGETTRPIVKLRLLPNPQPHQEITTQIQAPPDPKTTNDTENPGETNKQHRKTEKSDKKNSGFIKFGEKILTEQ